jgi:molybdate transport system substrate-binding protein
MRKSIASIVVAFVLNAGCAPTPTSEVRVTVASNFAEPMTRIAALFQTETGLRVSLSFASTGKHYAQIRNGAPFDAFFGADVERTRRLEEEGVGIPHSRFTYAVGRLALWSPMSDLVDEHGRVLADSAFRFLAIANPDLAPYGRAAREVLKNTGVWDRLANRLVRGENVAQTFQYVRSGNAELGFVAYSQIRGPERALGGSAWLVPDSLHTPVEQQALLLSDTEEARAFFSFIRSAEARRVIQDFGYHTP